MSVQSSIPQVTTKVARSRFVLITNLSEYPEALNECPNVNWNNLIPHESDPRFYRSMNIQILFFLKNIPVLSRIRDICAIFEIGPTSYYKMFPSGKDPEAMVALSEELGQSETRRGRPRLVSADLEERLLHHIAEQQMRCDCLSPKECRSWLADQINSETRTILLDRFWWKRFVRRHDQIAVRRCDSREASRAGVQRDQVVPYLQNLREEIAGGVIPDLVINMDESGFSQRPWKGKRKNCVFLMDSPVKPSFRDEPDANHVTIVGAVTLAGYPLAPLLLSTRVKLPEEIDNSYLPGQYLYLHTPKGYLNRDAMDYWFDHILVPYVEATRARYQIPSKAILILDGLKAHDTPHVADLMAHHDIHVVLLPPHTSHLYQVLDLCVFGVMKTNYRGTGPLKSEFAEKISKKIEKVLTAWHGATCRRTIIAAWRSAGFVCTWQKGVITHFGINAAMILNKVAE
jgi:hypothetical protein